MIFYLEIHWFWSEKCLKTLNHEKIKITFLIFSWFIIKANVSRHAIQCLGPIKLYAVRDCLSTSTNSMSRLSVRGYSCQTLEIHGFRGIFGASEIKCKPATGHNFDSGMFSFSFWVLYNILYGTVEADYFFDFLFDSVPSKLGFETFFDFWWAGNHDIFLRFDVKESKIYPKK